MNYYVNDGQWYSEDELYHYGILGMKWGVRRYQNKDGTLTEEGRRRANRVFNAEAKAAMHPDSNITSQTRKVINKYDKYKTEEQRQADSQYNKAADEYDKYVDEYRKTHSDVQTEYEHDYDHTDIGKKLLKAVYDSDKVRKNAYAGSEWFWKYSNELLQAELKDYLKNK